MSKVCDLDVEKYRCISPDIRTGEVIITDKQVLYIKERHPGDFERYSRYFREIVEFPDYIIQDDRTYTGVVLKYIEEQEERFRLTLRLATSADNPEYKNSILTFLRIREQEWNRLLRNKKILYKSK